MSKQSLQRTTSYLLNNKKKDKKYVYYICNEQASVMLIPIALATSEGPAMLLARTVSPDPSQLVYTRYRNIIEGCATTHCYAVLQHILK